MGKGKKGAANNNKQEKPTQAEVAPAKKVDSQK